MFGFLKYTALTIQLNISLTLPISLLSNRTLIPCGWVGDFVKMSFTIPSVNLLVFWSFFKTIRTLVPGLMSAHIVPVIGSISYQSSFGCSPKAALPTRDHIFIALSSDKGSSPKMMSFLCNKSKSIRYEIIFASSTSSVSLY